jgi:hypothetical protein
MGSNVFVTAIVGPTTPEKTQKVNALKETCDKAYDYGPAQESCSHAAWYVIQQLVNKLEPYRKANELIDYMSGPNDWHEVGIEEGWKLANEGKVVIGGRKDSPNGHVIVIYPGTKIPGGGYMYSRTNRQTGKVEQKVMRSHGMLPRCLSRTHEGGWPGGLSDGDKNVFDPFGTDDHFKQVRFWTMDKP